MKSVPPSQVCVTALGEFCSFTQSHSDVQATSDTQQGQIEAPAHSKQCWKEQCSSTRHVGHTLGTPTMGVSWGYRDPNQSFAFSPLPTPYGCCARCLSFLFPPTSPCFFFFFCFFFFLWRNYYLQFNIFMFLWKLHGCAGWRSQTRVGKTAMVERERRGCGDGEGGGGKCHSPECRSRTYVHNHIHMLTSKSSGSSSEITNARVAVKQICIYKPPRRARAPRPGAGGTPSLALMRKERGGGGDLLP